MLHKKESPYDIDIKAGRCRRCLYCVQHCPAKAIKVEENNIKVIPERCILCGSCIKACPHHAMDHKSGLYRVTEYLSRAENTIACLDPSFPAALEQSTPRQVVTALKRLGFTEVWEGAFGAELVSQAYARLIEEDTKEHSLISSSCPVIVFFVQKYFPELIPNLVPFVSPMIAIGKVARRIRPGWKIVYITSCLAQMEEMIAPEVSGFIDEVITFRDLKQLIEKAGIKRRELSETEFDGPRPYLARVVPLIGGLYRSMGTNFDLLMDDISVTGGHKRAIGALKQVADGYTRAKFLDLVYCEGCIDGPYIDRELFLLGKRQAVARYAKAEMMKQNYESIMANIERYKDIDLRREFRNMEQNLPTPTNEQLRMILKSIGKEPPHNLDCGACGYSTCHEKAIAVAQGLTEAEYCLPYLLEQSKKIYQQLEKSHRELQLSHQALEQAQSHLIRTEKLASLGQLAAGVAHEINNPLGTITIYAHVLLKTLEPDDPRREDVDLIIKEAARTKDIVQGLLSFARETKLRPGPTNINELLEDVLGLLVNQSLFQNIKIKKNLSADSPTITADWTQLKQVFLNVLLNAAQAMEGKGTVTITTIARKNTIKVRIQDTGPGIPPEIMPRIFSPFFTTKEKGTGLGLAISYGIIERHGGKIDLKSELGKGTTAIISLPVRQDRERLQEDRFRAIV